MTYLLQTTPGPKSTICTVNIPNLIAAQQIAGSTFTFSSAWPSANMAFYYPIGLNTHYLIQQFFWVNGNSVSGTVDMGLYTQDGTRLTHTGATTQSGISVLQAASVTPIMVPPGQYYIAMVSSGTPNFFGSKPAGAIFDSNGICEQTSASPLPATATMTYSNFSIIPVAGFTVMTVI